MLECFVPRTFSRRWLQVVPTASGSNLVTWIGHNRNISGQGQTFIQLPQQTLETQKRMPNSRCSTWVAVCQETINIFNNPAITNAGDCPYYKNTRCDIQPLLLASEKHLILQGTNLIQNVNNLQIEFSIT